MLRQRMDHMIQKTDPGVYIYSLRFRDLCGMAFGLPIRSCAFFELFESPAIKIEGQLDFSFVGVAIQRRAAYPVRHSDILIFENVKGVNWC